MEYEQVDIETHDNSVILEEKFDELESFMTEETGNNEKKLSVSHSELANAIDTLDKQTYNDVMVSISKIIKTEHMDSGLAAQYILDFFGYSNRIIDNRLTAKDRDIFYIFEDAGFLKVDNEETTLRKGKPWRIHYWILPKDEISKRANSMYEEKDIVEKAIDIYDKVFGMEDDDWNYIITSNIIS